MASKGVDSAGVDNIDEIALAANEKFNIPIIVTGEVDAIAVNGEVVTIHNGSAMMPKSYWDRMLIRCCSSKLYRTRKRSRIEIIRNSNVGLQYRWRNGRKNVQMDIFLEHFKVEFINALYEITDEDVKEFKRVK